MYEILGVMQVYLIPRKHKIIKSLKAFELLCSIEVEKVCWKPYNLIYDI